MYHMVSPHLPKKQSKFNRLRVTPKEFEKQLQWCGVSYFDFYLMHAQNLGNYDKFKKGPIINNVAMISEARKALEKIGVTNINPALPARHYDMQERKLIEIAKCMYNDPELLIVDETTTALSQSGRDIIYRIMHEMADAGKPTVVGYTQKDIDTWAGVVARSIRAGGTIHFRRSRPPLARAEAQAAPITAAGGPHLVRAPARPPRPTGSGAYQG